MSAIFDMNIASETLDEDELTRITGSCRKGDQADWLTANGWIFHRSRAGHPIVGRLYARLKMAGINPATLAVPGGWAPDFTGL
ncbi:MAG: DUF4224 domain-containing protein [Porticoccaceae bacterium]